MPCRDCCGRGGDGHARAALTLFPIVGRTLGFVALLVVDVVLLVDAFMRFRIAHALELGLRCDVFLKVAAELPPCDGVGSIESMRSLSSFSRAVSVRRLSMAFSSLVRGTGQAPRCSVAGRRSIPPLRIEQRPAPWACPCPKGRLRFAQNPRPCPGGRSRCHGCKASARGAGTARLARGALRSVPR